MGPKPTDEGPGARRGEATDIEREEKTMRRWRQPVADRLQGMLAGAGSLGRQGSLLPSSLSDFWPPELWENKSLLLGAPPPPTLVVLRYDNLGKLVQMCTYLGAIILLNVVY